MAIDPIELARWQGQTEAHQAENSRRLDGINGSIENIQGNIGSMAKDVASLKAKVALWSALGGLLGAGLVSVAVTLGLGS